MTLLRIALRSHRTGAIAMALIGAAAGILNGVGYVQLVGDTPAARLQFAQQMEVLGRQLTYLLPAPVQLETLGGYLTWRAFGTVTLVFCVWAMLAGTGAARGDEERGLVEAWLSTGVSRVRWLVARSLGFLVMSALALAFGMAATELAAVLSHEPLDAGGMAAETLVMLGLTLVGFGIGAATAQLFVTRRAASSAAGGVILALFLMDSAQRSGADLGPFRDISPFALFDLSTPLLAGGHVDVAATAMLFAIAVVLVAFAIAAFARRDLGAAVFAVRRAPTALTYRTSRDPFLRMPVLAIVDQQRWWTLGWAAGLGLLAYFLTSIERTIIDSLESIPSLRVYVERMGLTNAADFIGLIWFSTALLIISVLVVVQVNGWAADDAEGRLETQLAMGMSRGRVVLERLAALVASVFVIAAVSTAVVALCAEAIGLRLPLERLVLAAACMLPVAFALGAVGHLLVGWRPRVAVLLLGAVAVISYFTQEFAPLFAWPSWVGKTSFFVLYGEPMTSDDRSGVLTLVAVGLAGTVAAVAAMRRRDVGA